MNTPNNGEHNANSKENCCIEFWRCTAATPNLLAIKRITMKHDSSTRPTAGARPERWAIDVGGAAAARLDIPADIQHERCFEISVSMTVRPHDDAADAWHELRVFADGQLQWSRRIGSQRPAAFDGLDYRFRRRVAVGRVLQLAAMAECHGGHRLRLLIEADEA